MSDDTKSSVFCALLLGVDGKREASTFRTESDADDYAIKHTEYGELDPDYDDPDHWDKYDPPMVLLLEAENTEAYFTGKYTRPVALYRQGEKWRIIKDEPTGF